MNTPFAFTPGRADAAVKPVTAPKKALGLIPMRANSDHQIQIRSAEGPLQIMYVKARPAAAVVAAVPDAICVCLHHGCRERSWPDEQRMREDERHKPDVMAKHQDAHVWGLWSTDPTDPNVAKVEGCVGCKKEKKWPCAAHRGPVVGLIAPPEQRAPDA